MAEIKAIETQYKGYRFRSRLEARWAVFFDALGIEYQYEPEGFEDVVWDGWSSEWVDGKLIEHQEEPKIVRYLPDFFLPRTGTWCEVKGCDDALRSDLARLTPFLDWGCPLPGFTESWCKNNKWNCPGLLILGEIPNGNEWGVNVHPIIVHRKGLLVEWALFERTGPRRLSDDAIDLIGSITGNEMFIGDVFDESSWGRFSAKSVLVTTKLARKSIRDAYSAARSARFEHGESPNVGGRR